MPTNHLDSCVLQHPDVEDLLGELTAIRADMVADSALLPREWLDEVHPNYRDSARNLLHYLALRRRDLRPLQHRLAVLGLSSLGRAESHVLTTMDAVLEALHRLAGQNGPSPIETGVDFDSGQRLPAGHTDALLGPAKPGRGVRIMVTMPTEAKEARSRPAGTGHGLHAHQLRPRRCRDLGADDRTPAPGRTVVGTILPSRDGPCRAKTAYRTYRAWASRGPGVPPP